MPPPDSDFDLQMMHRAIRLASEAAAIGEVPVGAVICQGQTVLAEAGNLRERSQDPTAHAEVLALRQAAEVLGSWRLIGCTMYVTLEPCPMCAGALVNARVDRLVYGASDPKMGCCRTFYELCDEPRFNHRMEVVPGVLAEETGQLLSQFFQARRQASKK